MLKIRCISVGPLESNCFIIHNDEGHAAIVDPGGDSDVIISALSSMELTVEYMIFTHAHFDHIGAADELYNIFGCSAIVHISDVDLLKDPVLNLSARFPGAPVVYSGDYTGVTEQTLELLGEEFTFLHTPGHTPGSMCIKTEDFLITGDTLFRLSIGNSFSPYGDIAQEKMSIRDKLFSIDTDLICYPGHGEPTSLFFEKNNNPYFY